MSGVFFGCSVAVDNVELAYVTRNGFVESRHVGSFVVTDSDGRVVMSAGDVDGLVIPRSTLKVFIGDALFDVVSGLDGLFKACSVSSHLASVEQLKVVRELLDLSGCSEADLGCPAMLPVDEESLGLAFASGVPRLPVYHCCSGKHAGMLLACVQNGWDLKSYLEPSHPLQQLILARTEELIGVKISGVAVDGCGAPVYVMSLHELAKGVHKVFDREVGKVMREFPVMIGGVGEPDTLLMQQTGVFAKSGYEGVFVASSGKYGFSLKIMDGNLRAAGLVTATVFNRLGEISDEQLAVYTESLNLELTGGSEVVGGVCTTL